MLGTQADFWGGGTITAVGISPWCTCRRRQHEHTEDDYMVSVSILRRNHDIRTQAWLHAGAAGGAGRGEPGGQG